MHPITESTHAHPIADDHSSQSKINHYSKDQEHIVLSSDFHKKESIIDLNHSKKSVPSLIELKPYIDPSSEHYHHHGVKVSKYDAEKYNKKYSAEHYDYGSGGGGGGDEEEFLPSMPSKSAAIKNVPAPDLSKHKPHQLHHQQEYQVESDYKISDAELAQYGNTYKTEEVEEVVSSPFVEYSYNHITPTYHKPTAIGSGHRFKGTVKKLSPITTAGLKHYGGGISSKPLPNKFFSRSLPVRNDYASYFHRTPKAQRIKFTASAGEGPVLFPSNDDMTHEQRVASARMIQSLLARKKQGRPFTTYNHYY